MSAAKLKSFSTSADPKMAKKYKAVTETGVSAVVLPDRTASEEAAPVSEQSVDGTPDTTYESQHLKDINRYVVIDSPGAYVR